MERQINSKKKQKKQKKKSCGLSRWKVTLRQFKLGAVTGRHEAACYERVKTEECLLPALWRCHHRPLWACLHTTALKIHLIPVRLSSHYRTSPIRRKTDAIISCVRTFWRSSGSFRMLWIRAASLSGNESSIDFCEAVWEALIRDKEWAYLVFMTDLLCMERQRSVIKCTCLEVRYLYFLIKEGLFKPTVLERETWRLLFHQLHFYNKLQLLIKWCSAFQMCRNYDAFQSPPKFHYFNCALAR